MMMAMMRMLVRIVRMIRMMIIIIIMIEKVHLHEAIKVCVAVNVSDIVAVGLVVVRKE